MNLKISLATHCIETEIKRRYNRAVSDYFKIRGGKAASSQNRNESNPDPDALAAQIELLQQALKRLDFNFLRSQYPDLRGDSTADVRIGRRDDNALFIAINGEEIETTDPN